MPSKVLNGQKKQSASPKEKPEKKAVSKKIHPEKKGKKFCLDPFYLYHDCSERATLSSVKKKFKLGPLGTRQFNERVPNAKQKKKY